MKLHEIKIGKYYYWIADGQHVGKCLDKDERGATFDSWMGGIHWLSAELINSGDTEMFKVTPRNLTAHDNQIYVKRNHG